MGQRLDLHADLIAALEAPEVYFQPPANVQMKYPCIVYKRNKEAPTYANNSLYTNTKCYTATVITPDPDSEVPDRVRRFPLTRFAQHFVADNLNHDVYDIYF